MIATMAASSARAHQASAPMRGNAAQTASPVTSASTAILTIRPVAVAVSAVWERWSSTSGTPSLLGGSPGLGGDGVADALRRGGGGVFAGGGPVDGVGLGTPEGLPDGVHRGDVRHRDRVLSGGGEALDVGVALGVRLGCGGECREAASGLGELELELLGDQD